MKIKKGDNVIVLAGKDRGKEGKVVRAIPTEDRLVVEGINIAKRRQRPQKQGQKGQVIEMAMPLHVSNVALKCAKCKKGVRAGIKITAGKKSRICRSCGATV